MNSQKPADCGSWRPVGEGEREGTGASFVQNTTCDHFLGGRLEIIQPASGAHRSGLDALLLAASLPEGARGDLMDLGSGVGVAGLAALALNPGLGLTLVDNDQAALRLARRNALRAHECLPTSAEPRIVSADITLSGAARRETGLEPQSADFVVTNPPYNDTVKARTSPNPERAHAHMLDDVGLRAWIKTAIWLLRPKGEVTLIVRTSRLVLTLAAFGQALGDVTILPVHARADQAASRILMRGKVGSKAPLQVLPGFVLHENSGSHFRPEAAAVFAGQSRIGLR